MAATGTDSETSLLCEALLWIYRHDESKSALGLVRRMNEAAKHEYDPDPDGKCVVCHLGRSYGFHPASRLASSHSIQPLVPNRARCEGLSLSYCFSAHGTT